MRFGGCRVDGASCAVRVVETPHCEQGQLSSLADGLNAIDRPGVNAALVTLIDVPLVAAETVRTLLQEYVRVRADRAARFARAGTAIR